MAPHARVAEMQSCQVPARLTKPFTRSYRALYLKKRAQCCARNRKTTDDQPSCALWGTWLRTSASFDPSLIASARLTQRARTDSASQRMALLLIMPFTAAHLYDLRAVGPRPGALHHRGAARGSSSRLPVPDHVVHAVIGGAMVLLVSLVAAAMSARPVLRLEPAVVFAGR